jgi:uncharacterized protein YbjT (DUF2867 family)
MRHGKTTVLGLCFDLWERNFILRSVNNDVQPCHRVRRVGIPRSPNRAMLGRRGDRCPRGRAPPGEGIHGRGAQNVARQAGNAGVERLIHVSGADADPAADSPYVRARGIGEDLVKGAFEGATILRPNVIFGPGDSFFNTLAGMARRTPVLPLFGRGRTNLQPVFVGDVAAACARILADPSTRGETYELGGPRVYTYKVLLRLVLKQVDRRRSLVPVPFFWWDILAGFMAFLPSPQLTRDQVKLMKRDNVIKGYEMTLEGLGIKPVSVEEILPT